MTYILDMPAVLRVRAALDTAAIKTEIVTLSDTARTAAEAASALGVEVGQIASSIVFKLPSGQPLLVITSGAHRVDMELVARNLGVEKLHRADADYVKVASGFSIGGVSPVGWVQPATVIIDEALNDYEVIWAAAGHPHAVFPTTFDELSTVTRAQSMIVGG